MKEVFQHSILLDLVLVDQIFVFHRAPRVCRCSLTTAVRVPGHQSSARRSHEQGTDREVSFSCRTRPNLDGVSTVTSTE